MHGEEQYGRRFPRRLLGYDVQKVDAFVDDASRAARSIEAGQQCDTDASAARAGEDIAVLLRAFAVSVTAMHDDAQDRASALVARAESHARDVVEVARTHADALLRDAQSRAGAIDRDARLHARQLVAQAQACATALTPRPSTVPPGCERDVSTDMFAR